MPMARAGLDTPAVRVVQPPRGGSTSSKEDFFYPFSYENILLVFYIPFLSLVFKPTLVIVGR